MLIVQEMTKYTCTSLYYMATMKSDTRWIMNKERKYP